MTNRELLKRLQELEAAERDVASSMDMPQECTANWEYAETAALARSAILQQEESLREIRNQSLEWALACPHDCPACNAMYDLIREGWFPTEMPRKAVAGDLGLRQPQSGQQPK